MFHICVYLHFLAHSTFEWHCLWLNRGKKIITLYEGFITMSELKTVMRTDVLFRNIGSQELNTEKFDSS